VILAGIALAGVAQVVTDPGSEPVEIVTADPTTTAGLDPTLATSTTLAEPFVYRVGVLSGVTTDNFWAFYGEQPSVWNSYILGPTKPALFTADSSLSSLQPELAAADAEPSKDAGGWQVVVDLRSDLAWSDGAPVTAHDLVFTFQTVRDLGLGGSWAEAFPETVRSLEAVGEHRVRIEFEGRPQLSVWPHGVGLAPIMARHVWQGSVDGVTKKELYDLSGDVDVGGGPLTVVSVSDELVVSQANSGYPGAGTPETIEYHVYANETLAVAALGEGKIDTILSPRGLAGDHLRAVESDPGVSVLNSPGNVIRYLGFNLDRDPMSDQAFRTALALLIDRDGLADTIPGAGQAAWSLVPQANTRWFDAGEAKKTTRRYEGSLDDRLAAAIATLEEAGYAWETPPGVDAEGTLTAGTGLIIDGSAPPPLTILTPGDEYDPARPEYVGEIAGVLGAIGFDARPVETDFDTVVDIAFTPGDDGAVQYDMYLLGWTLGNPALPGYYRTLFAADGAMNNTGYRSAAFAKALQTYEEAHTLDDARDALWAMERRLALDLPYLPLYSSDIAEVYRSDRIEFDMGPSLGGLQARQGGIWDVAPAG